MTTRPQGMLWPTQHTLWVHPWWMPAIGYRSSPYLFVVKLCEFSVTLVIEGELEQHISLLSARHDTCVGIGSIVLCAKRGRSWLEFDYL
jgi:hypothetical protein